ncbi:MAG: hypothetical protein QNJ98_09270 [Planctomycetota bacterium]|nr:hypothetical protein [Planctomycetota bacterium]
MTVSPRPRTPHHLLAYVLSLPERLLRFLAGLVGSLLFLLARLLPRPVREGKFYRLAVERNIKMLTDDVAQAGLFPGQAALSGEYATRMAVGGAVDNLLILGLHASPIWILLAATDLSKGAAKFTEEIAGELKEAGVLEEGSRLDSVDDVLAGLGRLSDRMAGTLDTPPLSVEDMKATVAAVRDDLKDVSATTMTRAVDLDGLAVDLMGLAQKEHRSLLETTSGVAVGSMRTVGNVVIGGLAGAGATVKVAGRRLWNDVILDYGDTIQRMHKLGFYGCLAGVLSPQARSSKRLFHYRFVTFTELGLSFLRWKQAPWRLP